METKIVGHRPIVTMADDDDEIDVVVQQKTKFEVYGEEMLEKDVKPCGNTGRIYLPPNWIGHQVKIIRID